MTAGMAKMIRNEVTSIDQTNSGMRSSDMPGARCLNTVTTISTATASAETSVKVIICAQMSARLPAPYCGPDKRHVGEPADIRPHVRAANATQSRRPPNRYIQ